MVPACRAFGVGVTVHRTRPASLTASMPGDYTVETPTTCYDMGMVLRLMRLKIPCKPFLASERAKEFVLSRYGRDFVTITLRRTHTPTRNSNEDAWEEACVMLAKAGKYPVVVPDTADSWRSGSWRGFETFQNAAVDFDLRLALYEAAEMNLAASGGPFMACIWSGHPFLMFKPIQQAYENHFVTTPDFLHRIGFPPGSQFPDHGPDRRIVWEPDSVEVVTREIGRWLEAVA